MNIPPCPFAVDRAGAVAALLAKTKDFDPTVPPLSLPVAVNISLFIINFFALNEHEGTMLVNAYFFRLWKDPRLSLNCLHNPLFLNPGERANIWTPSVSVLNYGVENTKAPEEPAGFVVIPGGTALQMHRFLFKVPCAIDYTRFPFDNMHCEITSAAAFEPSNDLKLYWSVSKPVQIDKNRNTLPSHYLLEVTYEDMFSPEYAGDKFMFRIADVAFKRYVTFYILQAFIPNAITVLVAWIGFSVNPDAVPGRMTLGVSSLITIVLQYGNQARSLPKIGYMTAMDVWMVMCTMFVFFTILEYGLICHMKRSSESGKKKKWAKDDSKLAEKLNAIDRYCRIGYLAAFFLFCLAYAIYGAVA